jgi:ribosomal protein S18 acetylase RimI-like enzyme
MQIRRLAADDVVAYRALRLRALQTNPEAFGSSYEETVAQPIAYMARRLVPSPDEPYTFFLGAFDPDLIGAVGFIRETRSKTRHKGAIISMYVAEVARGRGVGRALMERAIAEARQQPGLEQIVLMVVSSNEPAVRLYAACGFTRYGVEPCALKLGETCFDQDLMVLRLKDRS